VVHPFGALIEHPTSAHRVVAHLAIAHVAIVGKADGRAVGRQGGVGEAGEHPIEIRGAGGGDAVIWFAETQADAVHDAQDDRTRARLESGNGRQGF